MYELRNFFFFCIDLSQNFRFWIFLGIIFSFLEVNFSLFSIDLGKIADFRGTLDFPQCTIDESMNFLVSKR